MFGRRISDRTAIPLRAAHYRNDSGPVDQCAMEQVNYGSAPRGLPSRVSRAIEFYGLHEIDWNIGRSWVTARPGAVVPNASALIYWIAGPTEAVRVGDISHPVPLIPLEALLIRQAEVFRCDLLCFYRATSWVRIVASLTLDGSKCSNLMCNTVSFLRQRFWGVNVSGAAKSKEARYQERCRFPSIRTVQ